MDNISESFTISGRDYDTLMNGKLPETVRKILEMYTDLMPKKLSKEFLTCKPEFKKRVGNHNGDTVYLIMKVSKASRELLDFIVENPLLINYERD